MSDTANLFTMARSKLHVSVGGRDTCSLHRWVLLKNSIISSPSIPSGAPVSDLSSPEDSDTDDLVEVDSDSFLFPDAGKLVSSPGTSDNLITASEAQWLDSLLETLGDEDEDDYHYAPNHTVSILPVDEDDDQLLISPMGSPLSSTDDLPTHHHHSASSAACCPHPITVSYSYPYPVPYPPFHPPLIYPYQFDPSRAAFAPYDEALPYHDSEENLSVPDAIEDTSDDESDTPLTPSIGRSTTLGSPLTGERSALPHVGLGLAMGTGRPRVHYDLDDPYFYPFDPLPYNEPNHPYNSYQEC
ncbi:hypothetical protein DXG03_001110 [Asterophora parasitica]|uniref:Uncharacterized protein n=1 Tax=Asterophora parasitica TaxID=117018 RepID=A0A9P7GGZ9_9AGAR|nr:hypothetical protein DXG03_001110 [Asterophora parasitica]